MKKVMIFILLALSNLAVISQTVKNKSFTSGEKLKFVASYYMSSLWTDIAEITMEVTTVETSSRELYRLKCAASTYQAWDSYFKIRDLYESYVDKVTVKPFLFKRSIDEGGYKKSVKYIYKWKSGIADATVQKKTHPAVNYEIKISDETYDLVSVLYMIRNIDYETMKIGDSFKVKVLIDAKEEIVTVKYSGEETLNIAKLGKMNCYKLSVSLKDEKILKGKDLNNIWLTADAKRVPVLIKAEIPVGSIQVRIAEMTL
jgi:hypothetical protein